MFINIVPEQFLGEAIIMASYLINRMPSHVLEFRSPRHILTSTHPHVHSFNSRLLLKAFGCSSFVHIRHNHHTKLDPKFLKCFFLGYSSHRKGCKCYSPITRKVYKSMDVTFFEDQPYFTFRGSFQGNIRFWIFFKTLKPFSLHQILPKSEFNSCPCHYSDNWSNRGSHPYNITNSLKSTTTDTHNSKICVCRRRRPTECRGNYGNLALLITRTKSHCIR